MVNSENFDICVYKGQKDVIEIPNIKKGTKRGTEYSIRITLYINPFNYAFECVCNSITIYFSSTGLKLSFRRYMRDVIYYCSKCSFGLESDILIANVGFMTQIHVIRG